VSKLQQNFDLVAILVLAALLGLGHTPRLRNRIVRADWERSPAKVRIIPIKRFIPHILAR
jgi:hypothetical protein